jgi:hypothetical protein
VLALGDCSLRFRLVLKLVVTTRRDKMSVVGLVKSSLLLVPHAVGHDRPV